MHMQSFPSLTSRALLCLAGLATLGALEGCGSGGGEAADAGPFITITEISPDHGPLSGGNVITISGSGFTRPGVDRNQVLVGDALAGTVSVIDDSTIELIAPAGTEAGPASVTIFNGNGTAGLGDIYSYNELPTIASLSPETGDYFGGETITINGSGFQNLEPGDNLVFFGDAQASEVTVVDDGTLTVESPRGTLFGATEVVVKNDNGSSNAEPFGYAGDALLVFGHSRRNGGGLPAAAPVASNDGEVFQVDPISQTIEPTGATIAMSENDGVAICRAVTHDGDDVYARTHDGVVVQFGFEGESVEVLSPIEGCARVHGLAMHQGELYAYCRDNPNGRSFGRIDPVAKTFSSIGNVSGGFRINLVSDGTTLYLRTDSQISTINPNTGVRGQLVQILGSDTFAMRGMAFSNGELYTVSTSFNGIGEELTFLQSIDPNTGETDFVMTLGTGLRGLATSR